MLIGLKLHVTGADDVKVLTAIETVRIKLIAAEIINVSVEVGEISSIWVVDWVNVVCNDDKVLMCVKLGFKRSFLEINRYISYDK